MRSLLSRSAGTALVALIAFAVAVAPAPAQKPPPKPPVPESVVFEPDVEYANPDGQHLQLDLARPKSGTGPFPAAVCTHGGGFRAGPGQGSDGRCIKLADQGYVRVTVSYRLA